MAGEVGAKQARGKKRGEKKKKIKTFLMATNGVASQPTERRPTGMPTPHVPISNPIQNPHVILFFLFGLF